MHPNRPSRTAQMRGRGPGGRGPGGRGRGRGRGRQFEPVPTTTEELRAWFAGNVHDDWFIEPVSISFDRDEIVVTGALAAPKTEDGDAVAAAKARIEGFRENSRDDRIGIAARAEAKFERKVSWAVACGEAQEAYTMASVPVMTRLHMEERRTLDTLIDAGIARSRSEALAWSVQLVADNEAQWIGKLRSAMTEVEELRDQGPDSRS